MYGIFGRYPLEPPFLNNLGMGYGFTNAPTVFCTICGGSFVLGKTHEHSPRRLDILELYIKKYAPSLLYESEEFHYCSVE